MKRRRFLGAAIAAGLGSCVSAGARLSAMPVERLSAIGKEGNIGFARTSLEDLLEDCRLQLFDRYLPFWERGGFDERNGGVMCYLYDDGSVENDRKDIWYQGRAIWVYSFLYNNIDPNPKWLEIARKLRDFMVAHMHLGDGTWLDTVDRLGNSTDSIAIDRSNNIYGALFAASGLVQYAKATNSEEDLDLARRSIRKAVERYEDPQHRGIVAPGLDLAGLRAQGCSFMMVWLIPQLLELDRDPWFASLVSEHLDLLANKYWNSDYGISNEILLHDYSRPSSLAGWMVPGHSIEAQWMAMAEALREGNTALADLLKERMRRLIEMSWDYVFDGTCDTEYNVFASEGHPAGPALGIKTMWAQTEVSIGCMMAWERTGEIWAQEWFERSWQFLQRTMTTGHGVWRQAVDRQGKDMQRPGISIYRKGNFHQPRCLMMLILMLQRILARDDGSAASSGLG